MSEPTQESPDALGSSSPGSLGTMLRDAREARGLSEREAADTMNLSAHFLEALEKEQFDKLPAPAFVRGYLRSYSRMLGLSEEEVISCYYRVAGEDRTDPFFGSKREPRERSSEIVHEHTGQVLVAVFALAVLVILIALWAVWPAEEDERGAINDEPASEVRQGLLRPRRANVPSRASGIEARDSRARRSPCSKKP